MELKAVHHIAIIVSDYNKAKQFYVEKLGFEVIRENRRPDKNDIKLDLCFGDMELEIFVRPDAPARHSPEAQGLRHLAFKVASVDKTVKWLAGMGIECEPVRTDDYTGKKLTFFRDPDGLPLELHE